MRKILQLLIVFILIISCTNKPTSENYNLLMKSYKENNFFKLNNQFASVKYNDNNPDLLLYKAKLDYVFNKPKLSNILIDKIIDNYSSHFNDTIIADLIESRSNNSFRLQDYKAASEDIKILLANYSHIFDSLKLISLQEDLILRKAIQDIPKMTINKTKNKDIHIPIKRDLAGLINLSVRNCQDSADFIFDTGANISVISKSIAKAFNVKTLPEKAKVNSISGIKMDCELGYCDINIKEFEIKNALFLVLDDSLLSFGNGDYVINGIIGFPVINSFKELSLINDSILIIPEKVQTCNYSNFALDNLKPTILVVYNNDSLPFHFDTGADRTLLFSSFFERYKAEIEKNYSTVESSVSGVGGSSSANVFLIDSLNLGAGENEAKLDSIELLTKDLRHAHKFVYGNFGQDFMQKFSTIKINFESMCIIFSNN